MAKIDIKEELENLDNDSELLEKVKPYFNQYNDRIAKFEKSKIDHKEELVFIMKAMKDETGYPVQAFKILAGFYQKDETQINQKQSLEKTMLSLKQKLED